MKVKFLFLIPIFIAILMGQQFQSFGKSKEVPYLRDGISFSIEEGWKIIANDSIGDQAYYFSAERTGSKATGLITVTWANKEEDPDKTITAQQKSMKGSNIYRNPGIEFSKTGPGKLGGRNVLRCEYATIVKEQKIEGTIHCFNCSRKTVIIFFQSGIDDQNINNKAFELFQKTFNCRE
ncbi:MAG: hypothetical protein WCP85_14795 [Mariniphaga sp.]